MTVYGPLHTQVHIIYNCAEIIHIYTTDEPQNPPSPLPNHIIKGHIQIENNGADRGEIWKDTDDVRKA